MYLFVFLLDKVIIFHGFTELYGPVGDYRDCWLVYNITYRFKSKLQVKQSWSLKPYFYFLCPSYICITTFRVLPHPDSRGLPEQSSQLEHLNTEDRATCGLPSLHYQNIPLCCCHILCLLHITSIACLLKYLFKLLYNFNVSKFVTLVSTVFYYLLVWLNSRDS